MVWNIIICVVLVICHLDWKLNHISCILSRIGVVSHDSVCVMTMFQNKCFCMFRNVFTYITLFKGQGKTVGTEVPIM